VKEAYGPGCQAGASSKVRKLTVWASNTANKGALESLLYSSIPLQAKSTLFAHLNFVFDFRGQMSLAG
jgi:hypothetical protein